MSVSAKSFRGDSPPPVTPPKSTQHQRLALLLLRFNEPAFVVDRKGELHAANGRFCDFFRISPGQLKAAKCWDILKCRHHTGAPLCTPDCGFLRLQPTESATFDREVSLRRGRDQLGASISIRSVDGGASGSPFLLHTFIPGARLSLNQKAPPRGELAAGKSINAASSSPGPAPMRVLDSLFLHTALEDQISDHLIGVGTALGELAKMGGDNLELRDLARAAEDDLRKSTDWLGDLFRLVRCEEGLERVNPRNFRLFEAVRTVASGFQTNTKVSFRVDADPVVVFDPDHLKKILGILLDNAATHGGPEVRVTIAANGSTAKFEMSDTGNGISHRDLESLWDPTNLNGAVTMGLPLAKRLASLNLGSLQLTDPGRAAFCLTLPALDSSR